MGYRLVADVTVVVHFAFVVYLVVGGYLAWFWHRSIVAHAVAVTWGLAAITFGIACPLTSLENWSRVRAGQAALPASGFIDHYITGVIYPAQMLGLVRVLVVVAVAMSWFGYVAIHRPSVLGRRLTLRRS